MTRFGRGDQALAPVTRVAGPRDQPTLLQGGEALSDRLLGDMLAAAKAAAVVGPSSMIRASTAICEIGIPVERSPDSMRIRARSRVTAIANRIASLEVLVSGDLSLTP